MFYDRVISVMPPDHAWSTPEVMNIINALLRKSAIAHFNGPVNGLPVQEPDGTWRIFVNDDMGEVAKAEKILTKCGLTIVQIVDFDKKTE